MINANRNTENPTQPEKFFTQIALLEDMLKARQLLRGQPYANTLEKLERDSLVAEATKHIEQQYKVLLTFIGVAR